MAIPNGIWGLTDAQSREIRQEDDRQLFDWNLVNPTPELIAYNKRRNAKIEHYREINANTRLS